MIYFLFALIFPLMGNGPGMDPSTHDFTKVDKYARSVRKANSYERTAEKICEPLNSDLEKARAIFIWITDNVDYDVKRISGNYQGGKKTRISANSREELAKIKLKRQRDKANMAFKQGKGVCENYAYLFQFMANHVGLEAELVSGHGRNNAQYIGQLPRVSNHAWNSVKIDGKWYLLDATWAAGNTNPVDKKYTKSYKEGFFMSDPYLFITTHFPDDPKWQLLADPINGQQYANLPVGYHELSAGNVLDYFPTTGKLQNGPDGIQLSIVVKDPKTKLVVLDNRRVMPITPKREGNKFTFHIKSKRLRGHELTIASQKGGNTLPIISYKVI